MTKYAIACQKVIQRENASNGGKTVVEYVIDERYGIFNSVKEAKANFIKNHWDTELKNCKDVNFLVSHFDAMSRNLKCYKVMKVKE